VIRLFLAASLTVAFGLASDRAGAIPVSAIKTAVIKGTKLVVRYGDEVVCTIDDVTQVGGPVLREALGGVSDVQVFARVAKSRFPTEVSEKSVQRLESVADDLAKVPGAADVLRLLVASNQSNVKGALGELELAAFLIRRKGVLITSMREVVETGVGRTDIDIAFTCRGRSIILERKAIDGLGLTDELRQKIDKMAEIARTRDAIPILSVGEIPPTGPLMDYAASKGVEVTYGGYLRQCHMVEELLESSTLVAQ